LTIRETVQFSANMRLDESVDAETKEKFVDQVLEMLELDKEADLLVGSDNTGGLSFEQKKRLSIAVELAANPSIFFRVSVLSLHQLSLICFRFSFCCIS
jgi:ABC-type multidrug transport system ATPase subunit